MPDFTFQLMQQCIGKTSDTIGGYCQTGLGTERPRCTCKGFKYYGDCKHLRQARKDMCPYHELIHGKPTEDGICPLCGMPTEYVRVAV